MIWRRLRIICSSELPCLVQIGNKSESGTISLPRGYNLGRVVIRVRGVKRSLTDVASEPVLQTVNTFRPSPSPPHPPSTTPANQSPPHLAIALFRPTSSAATRRPSATNASAIARASCVPACRADWSVRARRRVAAPRLTAVGRAVKR